MSKGFDHIAFISETEIAEPKFRLLGLSKPEIPEDHKAEGYIVAGGVTAFTENVTGQAKQDILDATLFAQLAADKKHDREKDTHKWYDFYKYVLGNVGFVIESFEFQNYSVSGATFSMDKIVLEILAAIATGGEVAVILATIDAMRSLAEKDNKIMFFDSYSTKNTTGNFQIYPCDQSPSGDVSMSLGAFYFQAKEHHENFFFFSWKTSTTKIYKGAQKIVLNQAVYAKVRDQVSKKLGHKSNDLVVSVEL